MMQISEPELLASLKTTFGYDHFREGQLEIVETLLHGDDAFVVMPTGAGKSLCYQLPAILSDRKTIIVSPLVALMDDQVAALRQNGVAASKIHSHQSYDENADQWLTFASPGPQLLYMSPERLMQPRMLEALKQQSVGMFVVDEAHCISKWGAAFRPEYEALSQLKTLFPDAQIAAFTATADEATRQDIVQKLSDENCRVFLKGFDRPNLSLAVLPKEKLKDRLVDLLEPKRGQSGIVYCLSRKDTDEIAAVLSAKGFPALAYHAGKDGDYRREAQNRFMTEDGLIMVATIAFGMGIDKPDIRFVVHASLPSSMEAFYQEIGRAGRDGEPAETILFYSMQDFIKRQNMIFDGEGEGDFKLLEYKRLEALIGYCEATTCRRMSILTYFDESSTPCGNCDNCLDPPVVEDYSAKAQAIFSAIDQTGQFFGQAHILDVLKGAQNAKIRQRNHQDLACFGALADDPKPFMQSWMRQLIALGAVRANLARYGALEITEIGAQINAGKTAFMAKTPKASKTSSSSRGSSQGSGKKTTTLEGADDKLFQALKAVRLEIAQEKNIPAYAVFHDSALKEFATLKPKTRAQFEEINGVGPKKLDRYFEAFSSAIELYVSAHKHGG
ncbi:MAG: DNA helicase RecQ [Rhodobiaceae bacterium]|jgi:ATP-dependent DNA helicase RecQ|nr:DNA helicase RecQ [Rhodobiaceae bacterium]